MNLVIDIGNSIKKAALFENGKLDKVFEFTGSADELIRKLNPEKALISSVAGLSSFPLADLSIPLLLLKGDTPVPFLNAYKTPETLGTDRLAAAAGAYTLYPGSNCLVVDAGTCIKADFIDKSGIYYGGSISPGIKMRFKALNSFTSRLPLIEPEGTKTPLTGSSTKESILSGVLHGVCGEMESRIRSYREKYPDLKVLVCGGDSRFFESCLKESIFVLPELVLVGLNTILDYNVPEK